MRGPGNFAGVALVTRTMPKLHGHVLAGGGEHVAVRAEGHGKDFAGVARQSLLEEETERCTTLEFDVGGPAVL
jgi:uncharacterized protein YqkB